MSSHKDFRSAHVWSLRRSCWAVYVVMIVTLLQPTTCQAKKHQPVSLEAVCEASTSCTTCVASPGCSWFYNQSLPQPFCSETPRVFSLQDPTLQARTPYSIMNRVTVVEKAPIDIRRRTKGKVFVTPQSINLLQSVGVRQEVLFSVVGKAKQLKVRMADQSDGDLQVTVVPVHKDSCAGKFSKKLKSVRNKKMKRPIPTEMITCGRRTAKEVTQMKLVVDTPKCFSGRKRVRIYVPMRKAKKSQKTLLVYVETNCQCPYIQLEDAGKQDGGLQATCHNDVCHRKPYTMSCGHNGTCLCGECVCAPGFSGEFCECDGFSCPAVGGGQQCGGPERGVCDCGRCRCNGQYSGQACELDISPLACLNTNSFYQVCSGHGACVDGRCECHSRFTGPLCQQRKRCSVYRHCVVCHVLGRDDFSTGDLDCQRCKDDPVTYLPSQSDDDHMCDVSLANGCRIHFSYLHLAPGKDTVHLDKDIDCSKI